MTQVIYSIGVRFAGGGIGNIAYKAVQGLYQRQMLHRLLCGSRRTTEIPPQKIRSLGFPSRGLRQLALYAHQFTYWHNRLYDLWATRHIERADLFLGWNGFCLHSLQQAKRLGSVTVVERASTHNLYQQAVLAEEYGRFGLPFPNSPNLERALKEYEFADFVLVPSQFAYESFIQQGFPPEKVQLVPFGVDTKRFFPAKEQEKRPFRVLFVGQIGLRKGVVYLLQAWQKLGWRDAELYLVGRVETGNGRVFQPYHNLPGLHWTNHIPNPVSLYQQADVFVFPSLEEGSALVTYEAMACGLPVITTPNAGSVVRHNQEGFIVPIRDPDTLANCLETLRSDQHLRHQMSQAARNRAQQFTWETYQENLCTTLKQCHKNYR
ncbi:MAG: glycosyltransferase family 1 protein [Chloroflexi bacterium]|nr:MAG: glycosyltransferase family 1 protein [Chloroflexota bacterium]